jgi:hypothetical protein
MRDKGGSFIKAICVEITSLHRVIDEMPHIVGAIPEGNGHTGRLLKLAATHVKQLLR